MEMQKVIANGPTNDLTVNVCSFFNAIETMKKENYCVNYEPKTCFSSAI